MSGRESRCRICDAPFHAVGSQRYCGLPCSRAARARRDAERRVEEIRQNGLVRIKPETDEQIARCAGVIARDREIENWQLRARGFGSHVIEAARLKAGVAAPTATSGTIKDLQRRLAEVAPERVSLPFRSKFKARAK